MKIEFDKRTFKRLQGRFEQYEFEVGILEDKPHKNPREESGALADLGLAKPQLGSFAGGPVRKLGRGSNSTVAQVSAANSKRLGFNYLLRPFRKQNDSEITRFANAFMKFALTQNNASMDRRVTNLIQAIVRNPILRGEYGAPNSEVTQMIKGFDRPMIDTGQLFKNIKARVKRQRRRFSRG